MVKRILVVDDEMDIRMLIKKLLEEEYDISLAEDGREALEILVSEKFDLVLMDMFMPGMSGRETCMRIRENHNTKNTKIAFDYSRAWCEGGGAVEGTWQFRLHP